MELGLTIGAVARATDIPANTLRTWERRYGFPAPERSDGGQRLYNPEVVPRLRLVSLALSQGHRARQVLTATMEQLQELVGPSVVEELRAEPTGDVVRDWLEAAKVLDGTFLEAGFRRESSRMGLLPFLTKRLAPFLRVMGEAWTDGDLAVYQEHFAAERVKTFLYSSWRDLADKARGPRVVCATLPHERHDLGLHMATSVIALSGLRVVFLGPDTPHEDIISAVESAGAVALMVSVSGFSDPVFVREQLLALQGRLPNGVDLLIGGAGAPKDIAGIHVIHQFETLLDWASRALGS